MNLEALILLLVNLLVPVWGILANIYFRKPKRLPFSAGADFLACIAAADLLMLAASTGASDALPLHPHANLLPAMIVLAFLVTTVVWAHVVSCSEPRLSSSPKWPGLLFIHECDTTIGIKQVWAWFLVSAVYFAHSVFLYLPGVIPGFEFGG